MKMRVLMLLTSLVICSAARADLVVIVNAHSPVQALTKDEVSRIYLKKLQNLPLLNNFEVYPIGQGARPATYEFFYTSITEKNNTQWRAYWARMMFTGRDKPPIDGLNNEGVKALVAQSPSAVGFIDEAAMDDRYRVVYRVQK